MDVETTKTRSKRIRRTEDQMVNDMTILVNNQNLSYGTKFFALNNTIWNWTERFGKYEGCKDPERPGCPYWSSAALAEVAKLGIRRNVSKHLRHEHIVPRILMIDWILGTEDKPGPQWTKEKMQDLFKRYCIGVVVTKNEDDEKFKHELKKSMPLSWELGGCSWARYAEAQIEVKEARVTWGKGKFNVEPRNVLVFSWRSPN